MLDAVRDFLLTAALLPGLAVSSMSQPGLPAGTRMATLDTSQVPWRGLLRVQTELGERCTGFLVAPQVAITAAHCLFIIRTGHFLQPGSIHVVRGYQLGRFDAHARVQRYIIPARYNPRREADSAGLDRAVLLLDHPIGMGSDLVPIAPAAPPAGTALRLGGYGRGRDERPAEGPACRVLALFHDPAGHRLIAHDCAGTLGTSGAPLLAQGPGGTWWAVGVQIEARLGEVGGVAASIATDTASDR